MPPEGGPFGLDSAKDSGRGVANFAFAGDLRLFFYQTKVFVIQNVARFHAVQIQFRPKVFVCFAVFVLLGHLVKNEIGGDIEFGLNVVKLVWAFEKL